MGFILLGGLLTYALIRLSFEVWEDIEMKRGMKMNRLKIIKMLEALEVNKENLTNALSDMDSRYHEGINLWFNIEGNIYNKKYEGNLISCSETIIKGYIVEELKYIEKEINSLIEKLK